MVPTLQLPLKPWPDPPLVLEVLLDAYTVSRPPSRPPGFPCCLSRIPSSTPGFPGCLSCILSRSRKNGKWKALLSSHSYTAKLLTLIEPTRVHKYPFNSFIARNILFSMIWGKGAPCKLAFGGTKGVFKLFSLFFLHLTPSLIIFFIWT